MVQQKHCWKRFYNVCFYYTPFTRMRFSKPFFFLKCLRTNRATKLLTTVQLWCDRPRLYNSETFFTSKKSTKVINLTKSIERKIGNIFHFVEKIRIVESSLKEIKFVKRKSKVEAALSSKLSLVS